MSTDVQLCAVPDTHMLQSLHGGPEDFLQPTLLQEMGFIPVSLAKSQSSQLPELIKELGAAGARPL